MKWLKNEFHTLRPFFAVFIAAGVTVGVAWVYRMGFESGMMNGLNNQEVLQDESFRKQARIDAERLNTRGY